MANLKILFVADPIQGLKPQSDTSLFMASEFLKAGLEAHWASPQDLHWVGSGLKVRGLKIKPFALGQLPTVDEVVFHSIDEFAGVMIRKDPPFNELYQRMCWMLAPYEHKITMFNRPSQLIRYHEKMLPYEAMIQGYLSPDEIIPMSLVSDPRDLEAFVNEFPSETYVVKPWLGFGGHNILRETRENLVRGKVPDELVASQFYIVQPFVESIMTEGDRRVFFINGHYSGSFVRLPKAGEFVSNLAQGGRAEVRELSRDQRKVIAKLEKFLHELKIVFAGADLIGHKVSEINITSPTGLVKFMELTGENKATEFVKAFQ